MSTWRSIGRGSLPYVGHFWSLAVEEQFYLVWPIVVLYLRRRSLLGICVAVTILALALAQSRLSYAGAGYVAQVVLTPCRFDALCVGGFLALAVRAVGLERVARAARRSLGPLLGLVLLASGWNAVRGTLSDVVLPIRGTLIALTFGALLVTSLAAPTGSVLSRLLRSRVMCFLGTRSYGLYVFHGIIAYGMASTGRRSTRWRENRVRAALLIAAAFGTVELSILVAAASYELFEKPFLRLKNRLAPPRRNAPAAAGHLDARPAE
jgi:peptidoglycan/LPS O-acetylase OafA/YrhL